MDPFTIGAIVAGAGSLLGFGLGKSNTSSGQMDKSQSFGSGLLEVGTKKDMTTQYYNTQTTNTPTSIYSPTTSTTTTYAPQSSLTYIIDSPNASASISPVSTPYVTTTQTPTITSSPYVIPLQDYNASPKTAQESTLSGFMPYLLIAGAAGFLLLSGKRSGKK
jgi:hypothetical protein